MQRRRSLLLALTPLLALYACLLLFPHAALADEVTRPASLQDVASDRSDSSRMLQPEDLFQYHRIGDVRFAPDGQRLAYELARPGGDGAVKRLPQHMNAHSDIWIASGPETEPRRLTDGASEGTGWFHPRWSPDGEHLAFLSVNGNQVRAWLWERGTTRPQPLTDRSVHLTNVGPFFFHWVSEQTLALGLLPEGAPASGRMLAEQTRPGSAAAQKWEASWTGREITADVFGGSSTTDENVYLPRIELVLFDKNGSTRRAAAGRWAVAVPSPNGRWAATLSDVPVGAVNPNQPLRRKLTFANRPGVVPLTATADDTTAATPQSWEALDDPLPRTLRWAPDGSAFALLTRSFGDDGTPAGVGVAVGWPGAENVRFVGDPTMQIQGFAWTGDGILLVKGRPTSEKADTDQSHWWRPPTDDDGEWKNWTAGMEKIPGELVALPDGAAGLVDGTLWRFGDGGREQLLQATRGELRRLMRPVPPFKPGPAPPRGRVPDDPLRILAAGADGQELWTVQSESGSVNVVDRLPMPSGARSPSDIAPDGRAAAFTASNERGTWLWRSASQRWAQSTTSEDANAAPNDATTVDTVVARDQWLEHVEPAETRQFTYPGPDGDELTAWILLPPGKTPDNGHPTVAWIYPGQVHGGRLPRLARLNGYHVTSGIVVPQLLASRGYAVLMPSVPLTSDDSTARPQLAETVVTAVDRAAEEGWTDASRVGVIGHSYGGYGVNHLVSQTDRFEAAVAAASFAHLRSFYGTFDARGRYGHMGHPLAMQLFTNAYFESGQGRMGAPPVRASRKYREASPLTYVDDVNTPLMLVHGDQDFIPVQQAEMFLNELLRLGKKAQLVRYAGEGHLFTGRANVLDMWERIFGWFGAHLGDPREEPDRAD